MELIICLILAVSAFVTAITCIVGLVSAPTPILLAILATGMLLTQKSITKFTETTFIMDDRDKNRIEKLEVASNTLTIEDSQEKKSSMTYRGFHYNRLKYNRLKNVESIPQSKQNNVTYRGAKIDQSKKEIV